MDVESNEVPEPSPELSPVTGSTHGSWPDVLVEVGDLIRLTRWRAGLSQRDLAERLGVTRSRIARLENSAGSQTLAHVEEVLRPCGYQIRVVARPAGPDGCVRQTQDSGGADQDTSDRDVSDRDVTDRDVSDRDVTDRDEDWFVGPGRGDRRFAVLPRDAAGRRFPAHAQVVSVATAGWWFTSRSGQPTGQGRPPWVWTRPFSR